MDDKSPLVNENQNDSLNILEEIQNQSKDNLEEENLKIIRGLENESIYHKSIKVILLGDSSVGKSSIIRRLCFKDYQKALPTTISIELYNYLVKVNDYIIRMQIWDTAGQEKYYSIVKKYYESTDFGIYVYSIDNIQNFYKIKDWISEVKENNAKTGNNEMKSILLANKKDLNDENRKISFEQGEALSKEYNFYLFKEISCKTQTEEEINNILDVFDTIAKYYYYKSNRESISASSNDSMNYEASNSFIQLAKDVKKLKKEKKKEKKGCC